MRHPWWRTEAKLAIVFTYFFFFFFFVHLLLDVEKWYLFWKLVAVILGLKLKTFQEQRLLKLLYLFESV